MVKGERTASMTGLVFTRNVALATVVCFTEKMKVKKCRHRKTPEPTAKVKSRLPRNRRLRPINANKINATAAIETRKNVIDTADASDANLTKIALVPKKIEPSIRAIMPLDGNKP